MVAAVVSQGRTKFWGVDTKTSGMSFYWRYIFVCSFCVCVYSVVFLLGRVVSCCLKLEPIIFS